MPIFNFTKTYHDGNPLFEVDLDNLRTSIETAVNSTGFDFQNFQTAGINSTSFKDSGIFIQPGVVVMYGAATAPSGWLNCDGSSVLVASYPALFATIGYTYGGSGANFNLPNTQERVAVGQGTMGSTSPAGLITIPITNLDTSVLGNLGGGEALPAHTHDGSLLTSDFSGAHSHTHVATHVHSTTLRGYIGFTSSGPSEDFSLVAEIPDPTSVNYSPVAYIAKNAFTGVTVQANSGQHSHNLTGTFGTNSNTSGIANGVVQPVIVLNKIIKY